MIALHIPRLLSLSLRYVFLYQKVLQQKKKGISDFVATMFLEEKRIKKKKKEAAKQKKCLWVLVLVLSMDISLEKLVLCSPTDTLTYISHREVVPCQLSTIRSTHSENLQCISASTTGTAFTHLSEAEFSFSKEHYWQERETDLSAPSSKVLCASNPSK